MSLLSRLPAVGVAAFAAVMAASWLALLLAECGIFSAMPCFGFGLAAGMFAARFTGPASRLSWWQVAALVVALAPFYFTRNAGELLLGGWDPGVYLQTAAHIAREGSLLISAPDLNRLTADELSILTRTTSNILGPFSGMWMLPDGRLSPQFHHLYPSLLAIAFSLGGVKAALLVNPLLNAGSLLAFHALASRFVRPALALAAAALLALNPAQLWQAKFSTAEMLGQFLLLGGAVCMMDAINERSPRRNGLLAGAAFGLALLARYDSIILLAPLAALVVAAGPWLPSRRGALWTGLGLAPLVAHHLIHHHHFAPYYRPVSGLVLQTLAAVGLGLLVWLALSRVAAIRSWAAERAHWLRRVAAVGTGLWILFAWSRPFWPRHWPMTGDDAGNALFLSALFGPGVWVVLTTLVAWLWHERNVVRAIWLYAAVAVLAVVTTSVFNDHFLMWVARRFIPVSVPLLVLAPVAVAELILSRWPARGMAVAALLAALVAGQGTAIRAMALLRDWPGLTDWTARVAAAVPPGASFYSDQWGFAAPLRYFHGIRAYEMHGTRDAESLKRLASVMQEAARRGERVVFLSLSPPTVPGSRVIGPFPLDSQRMETSRTRVPTTTKASGGNFVLYEIAAP